MRGSCCLRKTTNFGHPRAWLKYGSSGCTKPHWIPGTPWWLLLKKSQTQRGRGACRLRGRSVYFTWHRVRKAHNPIIKAATLHWRTSIESALKKKIHYEILGVQDTMSIEFVTCLNLASRHSRLACQSFYNSSLIIINWYTKNVVFIIFWLFLLILNKNKNYFLTN